MTKGPINPAASTSSHVPLSLGWSDVQVVSTVMSGILFACFPTVDYVTHSYSFLFCRSNLNLVNFDMLIFGHLVFSLFGRMVRNIRSSGFYFFGSPASV